MSTDTMRMWIVSFCALQIYDDLESVVRMYVLQYISGVMRSVQE